MQQPTISHDVDDTLYDVNGTQRYHQYCEDTLGSILRTPNAGILVSSWTFPHRKYAQLREQLKHHRLRDFEIRDLFNGFTHKRHQYLNTFEQPELIAHGSWKVPGNEQKGGGTWNNMMMLCHGATHLKPCAKVNALRRDCEWVTWQGPYGHTSIETLTRSPLHAAQMMRRLVLSAHARDLIWFTSYDSKTNAFSVTHVFPAEHLRRAILLGRWPFHVRGFT